MIALSECTLARIVRIMRNCNLVALTAEFSGGNDSGSLEPINAETITGEARILDETSYGRHIHTPQGGWRVIHELLTPEQAQINRLYGLVWGPIEAEYGSFAGEFSCYGHIAVDLRRWQPGDPFACVDVADHYQEDQWNDDEEWDQSEEEAELEVPF